MLVSKLTLCSGVDAQRRFGGASLLASTPGRSPDRLRQTAHDGDRAHEARLRGACSRWDPMAVILLALAIAGFVGRSRGTLNEHEALPGAWAANGECALSSWKGPGGA